MKEKKRVRNLTIQVTDTFDAISMMKGIPSAPVEPLGHTWVATIRVTAESEFVRDGTLVLFEHLRHFIKQFDRKNLNDIFDIPSAENVAQKIADDIETMIQFPHLIKVTVLESHGASVEVEDTFY